MRNKSYRKPSAKAVSFDAEQDLHPLVVEPADSVTIELYLLSSISPLQRKVLTQIVSLSKIGYSEF